MLEAEFGVEPDVETRSLYELIRAGELTSRVRTAAPPHNLPASLTPFVGRDAELGELAVLHNSPQVRLLTLVGTGGMGKTRLALELARSSLEQFADGVFLVALAPLVSTSVIVPTLAATLGVTVHSGDPRQAVLEAVRDKRLLLILDNFEYLLEGVDIVVDLLQAAPQVKIIATSRERLNVRGEYVYSVHGMEYALDATPAEAAEAEAAQLFVHSVRRVQPHFRLNVDNFRDVLHICGLVQGMPLGLELAAAWADTLPLATIAASIEQSADFLAAQWRDVPRRQQSIRAVFDWSWQLLTEAERRVFQQLAVFRGGFTGEAARAVTGASRPMLASLVRKSLLHWGEFDAATSRYSIHELLRQFAREKLAEFDEGNGAASDALRHDHAAFFTAFAEQAAPELAGPHTANGSCACNWNTITYAPRWSGRLRAWREGWPRRPI